MPPKFPLLFWGRWAPGKPLAKHTLGHWGRTRAPSGGHMGTSVARRWGGCPAPSSRSQWETEAPPSSGRVFRS